MKTRAAVLVAMLISWGAMSAGAQQAPPKEASGTAATARTITLEEAEQMALKNNHIVRLSSMKVEERQHEKDAAKSYYYPLLTNESTAAHLTDLEHIVVPTGSFGSAAGTFIPPQATVIGQGSLDLQTSATELSEPLTSLLKIREKNNIAGAELGASRAESRETRNEVVQRVRQLYYNVLVAQSRHAAIEAAVRATELLAKERTQEVKYGSVLTQEEIESRAQSLQAKQDMLTIELQLSDLTVQLNDAIGLPLGTQLALEPIARERNEPCSLEECKTLATASHPEVEKARQEVEKASAAVRLARREYIPDTEVFARHRYQNGVPFLVHNYGIFGFSLSYDMFEGGRRRAELGARHSQLDQAKENLARVTDEIEVKVQTAYNKMERTREMVRVAEELVALRTESHRVSEQQLREGSALESQAASGAAHELEAKASLLSAQLEYSQAKDELDVAVGRTPE
jgi:outer membrane protein TolC